jgi:predicted DsbA family dithiol-disulfide isomerase
MNTDQAAGTFHLDIVSDTICPWCYVGKRRLAQALSLLAAEGLAFDVRWRPFQLNPDLPKEGLDRRIYRSRKFGSWEKSQALDRQVAEAGQADGLGFRHDLMIKTPNTLASHALIRFAYTVGGAALQERAVEALFAAYFTQGRDIGDPDALADIGEEAGLDRNRVIALVSDSASAAAVVDDERLARELGLTGVPSFVLEGDHLFSGAQPVASIVRTLRAATADLARRGVSREKGADRVDDRR